MLAPLRACRRAASVPLLFLLGSLLSLGIAAADGGHPYEPGTTDPPRFLDKVSPGTGTELIRLVVPWSPEPPPSGAAAAGYTRLNMTPLQRIVPPGGLESMVEAVYRCPSTRSVFDRTTADPSCMALRSSPCGPLGPDAYCLRVDYPTPGTITLEFPQSNTPLRLAMRVQQQSIDPQPGVEYHIMDALRVRFWNPVWTGGITADEVGITFISSLPSAASLRIEGDDGQEVRVSGTTTDAVHSLRASGYDANGRFVGYQPVSWSLSDASMGRLDPTTGPETTFEPTRPGPVKLVATMAGLTAEVSWVISVGAPATLKITDAPGGSGEEVGDLSLSADDTVELFAVAEDEDGNHLGGVPVSWSVSAPSAACGSVTPEKGVTTRFEATRAGVSGCRVDATTISGPQLSATTGEILVHPGEAMRIEIRDAPLGGGSVVGDRSLATDAELTLHAALVDADGNFVDDAVVDWSVVPAPDDSAATLRSCGALAPTTGRITTFNPTAPTGAVPCRISANPQDGLPPAATGAIAVASGEVASIRIRTAAEGSGAALGTLALAAGDTLALYASGYDEDGNFVADLAAGAWSVTDPSVALITSTGAPASLHALHPGSVRITVTIGALAGTSADLLVLPGAPAALVVRTAPGGAGDELGSLTPRSEDEVVLYAALHDALGHHVRDPVVEWAVEGDCGKVTPRMGESTTFTAGSFAEAGCVLRLTGGGMVAAVPVVLQTPFPDEVRIVDGDGADVASLDLRAGETLQLYAVGFKDGEAIGLQGNTSWTVVSTSGGPCGILGSGSGATSTFEATTTTIDVLGTVEGCAVRARLMEGDSTIEDIAVATVRPGDSGWFEMSGIPAEAVAGEAFSFTVTVRDTHGNLKTDYVSTVTFVVPSVGPDVQRSTKPADYTFTTADLGVRTFEATHKRATDGTSVANEITVQQQTATPAPPAPATGVTTVTYPTAPSTLQILLPGQTIDANLNVGGTASARTAGEPFIAILRAIDPYRNLVRFGPHDYSGDRVTVFSGVGGAPDGTAATAVDKHGVARPMGSSTMLDFSGGTATTTLTYYRAAPATLAATSEGAAAGTSSSVPVNPAPATQISLQLPGQGFDASANIVTGVPTSPAFTAGMGAPVTVRVLDPWRNLVTPTSADLVFSGPADAPDGTGPKATRNPSGTTDTVQDTPFGQPTRRTFSAGATTPQVTLYRREAASTLTVSAIIGGSAVAATSAPFDVAAGAPYQLGILVGCVPSSNDRGCILASETVTTPWRPTVSTTYALRSAALDEWDNLRSDVVAVTWSSTGINPLLVSSAPSATLSWTPSSDAPGTISVSKPDYAGQSKLRSMDVRPQN